MRGYGFRVFPAEANPPELSGAGSGKPGSLLLIAGETEKHTKSIYENIPITSAYFKGRKEAVTPSIDLVPPEVRDVLLELLKNGMFYALTFRKPAAEEYCSGNPTPDTAFIPGASGFC